MLIKLNARFFTLSAFLLMAIALSSCGGPKPQPPAPPPPPAASSPAPAAATSPAPAAASPAVSAPPAAMSSTNAEKLQPSAEDLKLGVLPQGTTCPGKDPVKGKITKKRGKIYHLPKSPNYDQAKPEICFPDGATAEKAGFRAPK